MGRKGGRERRERGEGGKGRARCLQNQPHQWELLEEGGRGG